ncbi:hypothetical protein HYFRA_00001824 [Hymenoscyphus fraxineus]|uniref:MFS general substrate transporter n=1 Tax=Hymenoscyphus fraxineus TaxID=746836 RepID=A0A9N9KL79_9HELO|nr:hypothetical protein HYFRA_00001824 [Hymenoscyphus fraxineus]
MGSPPDTTRLLTETESRRTSIDTINDLPDESLLENGISEGQPLWENEGGEEVKIVSTKHMILLTCGTFGLQNVWSLLLANGTPYLLAIGFSRSTTALIWAAGPLAGTFIQPFIGTISDQSTSKYGKRKPFIIAGIVGAVLSMISMAVMRIAAAKFYNWIGREYIGAHVTLNMTRGLVIFWICVLNLSLQPIQVGLRALVVDSVPSQQQSEASAWLGRFTGLGGIATYLLDGWLIDRYGDKTFEILCIVTSLSLVITNLPCLVFASERKEERDLTGVKRSFRVGKLFKRLMNTTRRMPKSIKHICVIQFASWLGWFPFLFYNTTYISALDPHHTTSNMKTHPNSSGVQAYLFFAITSFVSSILLPLMIPTATNKPMSNGLSTMISYLHITLAKLWIFSQVLFAACMFSTSIITNTLGGTFMVAIVGISWALTQWVPMAMMSAEIANIREDGEAEDETGTLMSVFNVAISAPQILASGLCSGLFWVVRGMDLVDSLGWALKMGGLASVVAAGLIFFRK